MEAVITKDMVLGAAQVFEDEIESAEFFPWPLEPVIVFLEEAFERRNDTELLARMGLQDAINAAEEKNDQSTGGFEANLSVLLFELKIILDSVCRNPTFAKFSSAVLREWSTRFVPA